MAERTQVGIRFPVDEFEVITRLAQDEERPAADVVRRLAREALRARGLLPERRVLIARGRPTKRAA